MDKETLSNYGWIVICVLVLAVMIALAGPFGNFIADAVKSTAQGLFDVNQGALDAAGIVIDDNSFGNGGGYDHNAPELHPGETIPKGATYTTYVNGRWHGVDWLYDEIITLTEGDEFPETRTNDQYRYGDYVYTYGGLNGTHYGWKVVINSDISDNNQTSYSPILESINEIPVISLRDTFSDCTLLEVAPIIPSGIIDINQTFKGCTNLKTYTGSTDPDGDFSNYKLPSAITYLGHTFDSCASITKTPALDGIKTLADTFAHTSITTVTIPVSVTYLESSFYGCTALTSITYEGTIEQWNAIRKLDTWNTNVPATEVICSDGTVSLS